MRSEPLEPQSLRNRLSVRQLEFVRKPWRSLGCDEARCEPSHPIEQPMGDGPMVTP